MTKQVFSEIDAIIRGNGSLPGLTVSISNPNETISSAWGNFSDKNSRKVSIDTIYDLASITKIYTAYLFAELHIMGALDIYSPCSYFLNVFNNSKLRVIDLLIQKADFKIRLSDYRSKFGALISQEIFNIPPPHLASNEVVYENITFIYLGHILEVVLRQSLTDIFLNLFSRKGLRNTHLGLQDQYSFEAPPTEVINDKVISSVTHDETARLLGGVAGNAGVFSSAPDLVSFVRNWLADDDLKILTFKNYNQTGKLGQGLGWWNRAMELENMNPEIFSHSGFTGGVVLVHLASSTICVMLTNRTLYGRDNKNHRIIWKVLLNYLETL